MKEELFTLVGPRPTPEPPPAAPAKGPRRPLVQAALLAAICLGCLFCGVLAPRDPAYLDLAHAALPPGRDFLFGTDPLGRDLFSMIWYGGRVSLLIGFLSTAVSTAVAVVFGALSGVAPRWLDGLLMRFTEIVLSVPSLLLTVLLQAALGEPGVVSISLVIGLTGWPAIAKVVRTEVRRLRTSEYVVAARCMGGGFLHLLRRHLAPNFFPAILFMVVMNIRSAIAAESTLSFMGIGLPLEVLSWGSMLSLAERALSTGAWWVILLPGAFLVTTLVCVADIGNALREGGSRRHSNL